MVRRRAARTHAQNARGSLSPSSRESHATGPAAGPLEAQDAVVRVLPHPAPALTTVTGPRVPLSSSAVTWARATKLRGTRGRESLVVNTWGVAKVAPHRSEPGSLNGPTRRHVSLWPTVTVPRRARVVPDYPQRV